MKKYVQPFRCVIPICAIIAALICGCGKVGPPRIPEKTEPSPVMDLKAELLCGQIQVSWTRPFTNTDGTILKKIESVEIYREIKLPESGKGKKNGGKLAKGAVSEEGMEDEELSGTEESFSEDSTADYDTDDYEEETVTGGQDMLDEDMDTETDKQSKSGEKSKYYNLNRREIHTFERKEIIEILSQGDRFVYIDDGEDLVKHIIVQEEQDQRFFKGYQYTYNVKLYGVGNVPSKNSNNETVTFASLPARVMDLSAVPVERKVHLTWEPVTTLCNGEETDNIKGYNVYRSRDEKNFPGSPITKQPVPEAFYIDETIELDTPYFYNVKVVLKDPILENDPSDTVAALIRDTFPPAVPGGLTLVKGIDRINLVWVPNEEEDLAGYNVYRSQLPGRNYTRLNDILVTRPYYSDTTIKKGITYFYVITSVDMTDPPNESAYSIELSSVVR